MAEPPYTEQPGADEDQPAPKPTAEDLKDRFRAALDRKRGQANAGAAGGHGGSRGKVHEHRKAGGKRTFRRKSG